MLTLADKTTFITFNVRGRIQTISDSNGNVTAFSYNTLGQLQSEIIYNIKESIKIILYTLVNLLIIVDIEKIEKRINELLR